MGKKVQGQKRVYLTEEQVIELKDLGNKGYTAEGLQRHINMVHANMNITISQFYSIAKRYDIPYRRLKGKTINMSINNTEEQPSVVEEQPHNLEETQNTGVKKPRMIYTTEMIDYLKGFEHSGLDRVGITKLFNSKFPNANISVRQISDKIYHMDLDIEKPKTFTDGVQLSIDDLPKEPAVKYDEKLNIVVEKPSFDKFQISCKIKQTTFFPMKWEKTYVAHCASDALKAANADLAELLEQNTNLTITKRIVKKV